MLLETAADRYNLTFFRNLLSVSSFLSTPTDYFRRRQPRRRNAGFTSRSEFRRRNEIFRRDSASRF